MHHVNIISTDKLKDIQTCVDTGPPNKLQGHTKCSISLRALIIQTILWCIFYKEINKKQMPNCGFPRAASVTVPLSQAKCLIWYQVLPMLPRGFRLLIFRQLYVCISVILCSLHYNHKSGANILGQVLVFGTEYSRF